MAETPRPVAPTVVGAAGERTQPAGEDEVPWQRPPPGSRPPPMGSRGRGWMWAAGVVAVAVLAGLLVWLVGRGPVEPAGPETVGVPAGSAADRTDVAAGLDARLAAAPTDPVLVALRASERYLAFAEHERAQRAPSAIPGEPPGAEAWNLFAERGYANAEKLWDEVVGPIRDDALRAGEPYTQPIWEERSGTDAWIPGVWYDESTEGRGDAFRFAVRFLDPSTGEPVERTYGVIILANEVGRGHVAARQEAVDVGRRDVADFASSMELARSRMWDWVAAQPKRQNER